MTRLTLIERSYKRIKDCLNADSRQEYFFSLTYDASADRTVVQFDATRTTATDMLTGLETDGRLILETNLTAQDITESLLITIGQLAAIRIAHGFFVDYVLFTISNTLQQDLVAQNDVLLRVHI